MARLGAPARRFRRASPECESLSVLSTGAPDTVRRRGECVVGALGRARTAIPPCVACVNLSLSSLLARRIPSDGEGSAWLARLGAPARRFRRAAPECESHSTLYRTAIFAVLNGRPLQSDHALLSPLFSLLSTSCKVTTHYFLHSPPYSLQKYKYGLSSIRFSFWQLSR